MKPIRLTVNGKPVSAVVEPRQHLGDFLREHLLLTATHLGCEQGVCGACTVLVDGVPVRSCIVYAVACDGADVRTLEGLEEDEVVTQLRAAMSRHHGLQCGFCTPGMILAAKALLEDNRNPTELEVRQAIGGHLCRCGTYMRIVKSIQSAAEHVRNAP